MFTAAVSKADITSPVGVRMAGFAGRTMPSLAVHDPLWARCLVLDDGSRRIALVSLDLLYAEADIVAAARAQVCASTGMSPDAILIAGTHTHGGPRRTGDDATADEKAYWEALPGRIAGLITETASQLLPARISTASGWAAIGINRRLRIPGGSIILGRNEFGPFDPELGVVRIDRGDGAPLAALLNFACHGVCLVSDNRLLTGDYPGYAVHLLERRLEGKAMALFFNGACGNINPRELLTVGGGEAAIGSFIVAKRAGEALAAEAQRVWAEAVALENPSLSHRARVVELPVNPERALRQAEAGLREVERQAEASREPDSHDLSDRRGALDWARHRLQRVKDRGDAPVKAEVQAIAVGPLAFVGWPGEIFCELGMAVKRRSPFRPTYVIGYANGSIGYVPIRAAYPEGGYEVESAQHLADHAGEVLVEESASLLNSLHR